MQNFIVSARKYRPQTFQTVVGQQSITNTLKNAILNNQLAQAFLFCGPRGVGKTTCARILAKTINCENRTADGEACNTCTSCTSFNENASFNIYELDGASNNSVEDIRSLVDQVRIPPQSGQYKVYIIDEVHMLSAAAFNAFLKTLEEPPAYAKFILATTEKHKIIPTILSRCQIFDFRRITVDDIAAHLKYVAEKENIEAEEDALHVVAIKADGAMRDALSIFDQLVSFTGNKLTYQVVLENLNVLDYEYYFRVTDQVSQHLISDTLLTINDILEKGFDGQHFLTGFGEHLRNLLVCQDPETVKLLEAAPNIRQRYLDQAQVLKPYYLLKLLDISNKCDLSYKQSNNKRLHLELAMMQMCALESAVPASPKPSMTTSQPEKPKHPTPPPKTVAPPATSEVAPAKAVAAPPTSVSAPLKSETKPPTPISTPPETVPQKSTPEIPSPEEKPEARKPFKGIPGTISIKSPPKEENKSASDEEDNSGKPATPFSEEALKEYWSKFLKQIQEDYPHLYTTLSSQDPKLKENWVIELSLDNKVLENELHLIKRELMLYLKTQLNNYHITLQTNIAENRIEKKPYTDKEKFEKMASKNPELNNLREQLDLDIEY